MKKWGGGGAGEDKVLVISIFSFSPNVFQLFADKYQN